MKVTTYILIRLLVLGVALALIWNGAYYTLSTQIQEARFSFIAELYAIFKLSLIFDVAFLSFIGYEIYKFHKNEQPKLRNAAIVFSVFLILLVASLFMFDRIY